MASLRSSLYWALLVLCSLAGPCIGDGESCVDLGFSSNLMCSSCRELKEFGLESLEDDCKKCCQAEGVNRFIKGDRKSKFPNLQVRYRKGSNPVLKLLDDTNTVQDTLAIDKWDTDSIEEFLTEKLVKM